MYPLRITLTKSKVAYHTTLHIYNRQREIPQLTDKIDEFCSEANIPSDVAYACHLSVEELVTNIRMHGFGEENDEKITIELNREGRSVMITVIDTAPAFNPLDAEEPELDIGIEERPIGGLGIFFVRSVMDSIEYERKGKMNIITMQKDWCAEDDVIGGRAKNDCDI